MADKRARWGLLSTARINQRLIPCLKRSERNELMGVASRSRASAASYAAEHGIPKAYGSYEEMLADSTIDVVYVSLPNGLHTEWSLRCAEAGKHVLCEKPLALSVEEVEQLSEAAERCGVTIQEATMMRFHAQTSYVRNLIAEGAIGEVRMGRNSDKMVTTDGHPVNGYYYGSIDRRDVASALKCALEMPDISYDCFYIFSTPGGYKKGDVARTEKLLGWEPVYRFDADL